MKKKGSALLIVIIVMMVVFTLAAYMIDTSIKSNRQALGTYYKTKAYYSAETGMYDFINIINEDIHENIDNDNLSIYAGKTITNYYNNSGLYDDNMEVYKARLVKDVSISVIDNYTKKYTFQIYSSGNYSSQGCIIIADVSIVYVNNNYESYSIDSKKIYKS
ncbi:pilus assembly PilX N-terminal domain-containing protein [Clostridium sp. Mt-5]|uniref:Pilus assembly PilX N-terminal domain-containing protein n=1 Tax=Clostridium moutaii TaxID=3240932 RepID=A0ABV4BNR3_9CLOT